MTPSPQTVMSDSSIRPSSGARLGRPPLVGNAAIIKDGEQSGKFFVIGFVPVLERGDAAVVSPETRSIMELQDPISHDSTFGNGQLSPTFL